MYKDLQIQILEDVVETCVPSFDFEDHFAVYSIYARGAVVTQKRPTGLLELVQKAAYDDCSSVDVCEAVGLPPQQGMLTSVGMALSKLGWRRQKSRRPDGGNLWKWRKV